ncbi:MAG TPA: protein kinase, partial [Polyangiaceae bacterium]|nr:protein kinase [Polyangiaceae bacterium]
MRAGELIDGRFELEKLAGAGGSGSVYRALDRLSGEPVAVKLLKVRDAPLLQRFAREARILAELEHASIVRYISHGVTDQALSYLAMEWLEGQTLTRVLALRQKLEPRNAMTLLLQACRALGLAHA